MDDDNDDNESIKMKTGGYSLALAQISNGVREIILDLDYLRIKFGADQVQILTPKVETRLRLGYIGAISMKAKVTVANIINIKFIFDMGYPSALPLQIEISNISLDNNVYNYLMLEIDKIRCSRDPKINLYNNSRCIIDYVYSFVDQHHIIPTPPSVPCNDHNYDHVYNAASTENDDDIRYKCSKCRHILFNHTDLLPHQQLVSSSLSSSSGLNSDTLSTLCTNNTLCTSYFLQDRPDWLPLPPPDEHGDVLVVDGKLLCPMCQYKVGHWSWAGVRCGCGGWVTPGFQVRGTCVYNMQFMIFLLIVCVFCSCKYYSVYTLNCMYVYVCIRILHDRWSSPKSISVDL